MARLCHSGGRSRIVTALGQLGLQIETLHHTKQAKPLLCISVLLLCRHVLGVMVRACLIPVLGKQGHADLCELEASLTYNSKFWVSQHTK